MSVTRILYPFFSFFNIIIHSSPACCLTEIDRTLLYSAQHPRKDMPQKVSDRRYEVVRSEHESACCCWLALDRWCSRAIKEQIEPPCHHYDYCKEECRGCGGQKADRRGDSWSLGEASQPSPACCWELGLGSGAHEAEACGVL